MFRLIFTQEFNNYVREHSDLWIGYWVSLLGGTGGITLILGNPVWEFLGLIGGMVLTISSIILTFFLTVKAWYGTKKIKEELRSNLLENEHKKALIEETRIRTNLLNNNGVKEN